jgi:hypothetical protein
MLSIIDSQFLQVALALVVVAVFPLCDTSESQQFGHANTNAVAERFATTKLGEAGMT